MHLDKERAFNWAFRRLIAPFCQRFLPILVLPVGFQRWLLKRRNAGRRRRGEPLQVVTQLVPIALVWRHEDVCEVLGDHERFKVTGFDQRMTECKHRFLLGFDFTDEYRADIAELRSVLKPTDRAWIRSIAERHAQEGVASAIAKGRVDAVQDVVGPVVAGFLKEYFGVPDIGKPEPGRISPLLLLFLDTASYIFNLEILFGPTKDAAVAAGTRIKAHLDTLIGARRKTLPSTPAANETVLDRLLRIEPSDERVQRLLGGTVSGSIAVTFSQCLSVLDRLMDLPDQQRAKVGHVARSDGADTPTTRAPADEDLLDRYVREASRFNPFPPGILRSCDTQQMIARGTWRERVLEAGSIVVALTWSAAFDRRIVPDPCAFQISRDDREYLLFGTGQHHCVGAQTDRPIAQTLMCQMVKALMALPEIRRADEHGYVERTGRWPSTFMLQFDSAEAHEVRKLQAA